MKAKDIAELNFYMGFTLSCALAGLNLAAWIISDQFPGPITPQKQNTRRINKKGLSKGELQALGQELFIDVLDNLLEVFRSLDSKRWISFHLERQTIQSIFHEYGNLFSLCLTGLRVEPFAG